MRTISKDKGKEIAEGIFKDYPTAQKVIVASDGQAFISDENDMAAKNHSKNNRYKKELELFTFLRKEESTEQKPEKAEDLIALINSAETEEEVQKILDAENQLKKPRVSVVNAAKAKIETFKTE